MNQYNKIVERRKGLQISERTMSKLLHITVGDYKLVEKDPCECNVWLRRRVCIILGVSYDKI